MDNKRKDIDHLWMHCKNDERLLRCILEDYDYLRDQNVKLQTEIQLASEESRHIMRALWKERCNKQEEQERNDT